MLLKEVFEELQEILPIQLFSILNFRGHHLQGKNGVGELRRRFKKLIYGKGGLKSGQMIMNSTLGVRRIQ
jgi:hypothetical protein